MYKEVVGEVVTITEEDLLRKGFVKGELSLKYYLHRKRFISVFCVGTPNEAMYLCHSDSSDIVVDLVCVHNSDYDGMLSRDKIDYLINYFERDWRN